MLDDSVTARLNMIAAEIRHEHELIGQRMTWLVISQSFLFGTFATLIGQRSVAGAVKGTLRLLLVLTPLVGVLLPVVVLMAVGAATYAISQWRAERDRICEMPEAKQLDWPRLKHWRLVALLGQLLPFAVTIGFLVAWVVILVSIA